MRYPISKKTHSQETMRLLDWMGYAGEYKIKSNERGFLGPPVKEKHKKDLKTLKNEVGVPPVKEKHKKDLKKLKNELGGVLPPNSFGSNNLKHFGLNSKATNGGSWDPPYEKAA